MSAEPPVASAPQGAAQSNKPPQSLQPPEEIVEAELLEVREDVRALRQEVQHFQATIVQSIDVGTQLGLTSSQIEAIANAPEEMREVLMAKYAAAMDVTVRDTEQMTDLAIKDQSDGYKMVKAGLAVLGGIVLLLAAVAIFALTKGATGVAVAALSPIGVAAIGGVVSVALRGKRQA
ncbi:hypothetical protein ACFUC1_12395 [Pedococcus sp. NPDC057267]|uniref:hypothetical protein n=1 Tax=Pedococcus sp. NPDC057267 TaxID=3346077 RepID=UPI0036388A5C